MNKSSTKGALKKDESKEAKTPIKKDSISNGHGKDKLLTHPSKEVNVSGIINMDNINNDELLTNTADPLIVSAFQDRTEVNTTKNETKIDISEVLDDRWTNFSK